MALLRRAASWCWPAETWKGRGCKATILAKHTKTKVTCMQLDLSSLKSVRAFATAFTERYSKLDLLINNAGIMMPPYS
ncbi:MAG: SDR family NAD(P)-dependent oxidoreductase [Rhodocyclaceae bacterium]|nr:SDR family NAD(P)-dependent oxidoreductase [Rhodocyclaceae bacterium]